MQWSLRAEMPTETCVVIMLEMPLLKLWYAARIRGVELSSIKLCI
jgi:hypothetical protein